MHKIVPHKKTRSSRATARFYPATVEQVFYGKGYTPPIVKLSDQICITGTCLGCADTPCISLAAEELSLSTPLDQFPGDPSSNVCPTEAIIWDHTNEVVTVKTEDCIGCGLCVARCPYGAISLSDASTAHVETSDPDAITTPNLDDFERGHDSPTKLGEMIDCSSHDSDKLLTSLKQLNDGQQLRLVRNLFLALGYSAKVRRRGDTNVRIDGMVCSIVHHVGVLEIEYSESNLESPRALVEDIAVLHHRYSLPMGDLFPISILCQLPNARAEYYQVVEDIEKVLGIQVRTITVGALLSLLWTFSRLPSLADLGFTTKSAGADLRPDLHALLQDGVTVTEPYSGAFKTAK